MSRRLSPRTMFALLLSGAIVVSCTLGMTLSTVVEIRSVGISIMFAISVSVVPVDFVQIEDCVVVFV